MTKAGVVSDVVPSQNAVHTYLVSLLLRDHRIPQLQLQYRQSTRLSVFRASIRGNTVHTQDDTITPTYSWGTGLITLKKIITLSSIEKMDLVSVPIIGPR